MKGMHVIANKLQQSPCQQIKDLAARGAMFIVNHSGGKDSQAMFHYVHNHVPTAVSYTHLDVYKRQV